MPPPPDVTPFRGQLQGTSMGLDESTVADAYERYGHLVLRRCRNLMGNDEDAREALQDTFLRLWRYGGNFVEAQSPLRWLYRVAERVCFDRLSKERKRKAAAPTHSYHDHADVDPEGPSTDASDRLADRQIVLRFLGHLDKPLQRIAILHYVDQFAQGQIAEETGWSRQTVNKKLGQLRQKAKRLAHKWSVPS